MAKYQFDPSRQPTWMEDINKCRNIDNVEISPLQAVMMEIITKGIQYGREKKIHSARKVALICVGYLETAKVKPGEMGV